MPIGHSDGHYWEDEHEMARAQFLTPDNSDAPITQEPRTED